MALSTKHKILYILSSLCVVALLLNYQYVAQFTGFVDSEPDYRRSMRQEIFNILANESNGNICLIGLRGVALEEWIKYIHHTNKSLSDVFIINSTTTRVSEYKEIHLTTGELKEALSTFAFDQKLYECDFVHFGELDSEDNWEAAWLASRMFTKKNTTAIWSKNSAYNKTDVFLNQFCLEEFCSGFIPQIDFQNSVDVALQIQYAKHIPKKGYSINFFAYNPNRAKLKKAFGEVLASANTYRKNHPQGGKVQLTLFTNDRNFTDEDRLFDRIIGIKEEFMFKNERQWTTRVIFSSFAPAKISLFVDADSWSCLSMQSFFEFMDVHDFDFTINAHWPQDMLIPDCGVYAWKWSENTRKLMAQWFDEFGPEMKGDDQARLYAAMQRLQTEVNIGRTRSTHALRFAPGEGEGWGPVRLHQQTMILHGPVHIIHSRSGRVGVCDVLNQHADTKRVFVCHSGFTSNKTLTDDEKAVKLSQCLYPVFNQTECNVELDNKCFYQNDWSADPEVIVPAPDFHVDLLPHPDKSTPKPRKKKTGSLKNTYKRQRLSYGI